MVKDLKNDETEAMDQEGMDIDPDPSEQLIIVPDTNIWICELKRYLLVALRVMWTVNIFKKILNFVNFSS
jgi:hypothetical protein